MTLKFKNGLICHYDKQDQEIVCSRKWRIYKGRRAYYVYSTTKPRVQLHRLITNAPPSLEVDHKDGNGLNNRRENLRLATHSQNGVNTKHRFNKTGFRGVGKKDWEAGFVAQIGGNPQTYLGYFKTAIDAAKAYDAASIKRYGEFARLNFNPKKVR